MAPSGAAAGAFRRRGAPPTSPPRQQKRPAPSQGIPREPERLSDRGARLQARRRPCAPVLTRSPAHDGHRRRPPRLRVDTTAPPRTGPPARKITKSNPPPAGFVETGPSLGPPTAAPCRTPASAAERLYMKDCLYTSGPAPGPTGVTSSPACLRREPNTSDATRATTSPSTAPTTLRHAPGSARAEAASIKIHRPDRSVNRVTSRAAPTDHTAAAQGWRDHKPGPATPDHWKTRRPRPRADGRLEDRPGADAAARRHGHAAALTRAAASRQSNSASAVARTSLHRGLAAHVTSQG